MYVMRYIIITNLVHSTLKLLHGNPKLIDFYNMFNVFLIFCGCDNFREIRGNSRNMFPFVTVNTVHDMREYVLYGETIGELLNYFLK